jgi:hypothetical protein
MNDIYWIPAGVYPDGNRDRNGDRRPMNEQVIRVKTGIQKASSLKIGLRIAPIRYHEL